MPFLQRNRRSPYKTRSLLLLGVLILGSIFFSFTRGLFISLASPLWKGQNKLAEGIAHIVEYAKSHEALVKENRMLKERVASDSIYLLSCNVTAANQMNLLHTFGRATTTPGILASVLVRPPQTPYDMLVIDVGAKSGVEVGNAVSLPEGPSVGVVTEVMNSSSRVALYSRAGEKTNVILERHGVPAVLVGRGGGGFEIVVPRETEVEVGDRILSSSISGGLVGIVEEIDVSPTDSFKKILVSGVAHPNTLRYVTVQK